MVRTRSFRLLAPITVAALAFALPALADDPIVKLPSDTGALSRSDDVGCDRVLRRRFR